MQHTPNKKILNKDHVTKVQIKASEDLESGIFMDSLNAIKYNILGERDFFKIRKLREKGCDIAIFHFISI